MAAGTDIQAPDFSRFEEIDLARWTTLRSVAEKGYRLTVFTDKRKVTAWLLFQGLDKKARLEDADVRRVLRTVSVAVSPEGEEGLRTLLARAAQNPLDPGCSRPVLLARGFPPEDGRDSVTTWHVENPEPDDAGRNDGAVDHRAGTKYVIVRKGDLLFEVQPPVPGVSGKDIFGRTVPGYDGQWKRLLAGEFTEGNQSQTRVTATHDGYLKVKDGHLHVSPMLVVMDVNYQTGNLEYAGDAWVQGEITPGFSVKAHGLRVRTVNTGRVELQGRLECEENFFGAEGVENTVEGNTRLNKARNAVLRMDGNLEGLQEAVNCVLHAGGAVPAPQAVVVGGELLAVQGIEIAEAGNGQGSTQVLCVSARDALLPCLRQKRAAVEVARARVGKIEAKLGPLLANPAALQALSGPQKEAVAKLQQTLEAERFALQVAEGQLKGALKPLQERLRPRVLVRRAVHPGTRIRLGEAELLVQQAQTGPLLFELSRDGKSIEQSHPAL